MASRLPSETISAVAASDERINQIATTANRRNVTLKEAMTKTQFLNTLSESTGLHRKDVALVLH